MAVAALIIGIFSLGLALFGTEVVQLQVFAIFLSITGIVFGIVGIQEQDGRGKAITGLVLSVIGLSWSAFFTFITALTIGASKIH